MPEISDEEYAELMALRQSVTADPAEPVIVTPPAPSVEQIEAEAEAAARVIAAQAAAEVQIIEARTQADVTIADHTPPAEEPSSIFGGPSPSPDTEHWFWKKWK